MRQVLVRYIPDSEPEGRVNGIIALIEDVPEQYHYQEELKKKNRDLLQANADNYSLNAELDDESHTELADVVEQTMIPSAEEYIGRVRELHDERKWLDPQWGEEYHNPYDS